jgi:hypothetical protein
LTEHPAPTLALRGSVPSVRTPRFIVLAALATTAYILVVGVVTAVVPSPFFDRKLDVDAWNLMSLVVPALLFGPLAATYLVPWPSTCRVSGRAGAGGALSFLAAGCPVCNKLVVLAIGTTGAVEYFRPVQPALGAISVLLLAIALRARWQTHVRVDSS